MTLSVTIPWWWYMGLLCTVAYLAGVLTPFAYLAAEDWWFRRRMRKAGVLA